jgi:hypothetical protein
MGAACGKESGAAFKISESNTDPNGIESPFLELNDDVLRYILSYVSYAPFEKDASSTMTLSSMNLRGSRNEEEEAKSLLRAYNKASAKLKKSLHPRESLSPFKAPQAYYHEAFHGNPGKNQCLSGVGSLQVFGTLTHVLPLVNKRFHVLCNESNVLWTEALERLLGFRNSQSKSDFAAGDLWEKGILSLIESSNDTCEEETTENDDKIDVSNDESTRTEFEWTRKLIAKASERVAKQKSRQNVIKQENLLDRSHAKEVFRQVLLHHKPTRLPVLTMRYDNVPLGKEVAVRLSEPRYRLLIASIMAGRSDNERRGFPLSAPRPRFLFACKPSVWQSRVACIVDVRRCHIHRDGVADVIIVPLSWVLMQDISHRPNSGGLLDATMVRPPKRTRLPVFCMQTRLHLGQPVSLQFCERRYETLIADVMAGRPESERNGSFVAMPRPQFIFTCHTPLKTGNVACIVDVERCCILTDGTARLTVVPSSWALIEALAMRPALRSASLFDADATVLYPIREIV